MTGSERDGVDHFVLVGIVGRWLDLSVNEGALFQRPADVALPLVDGVLGVDVAGISCINDDLQAIDLLHANGIDHVAERKLDHFRWVTWSRWYVILGKERPDLERLLVSEALLCDQPSCTGQRYFLDDALRSLNLRLLRERDNDLGVVDQVDSVLRDEFEGDLRRLLYNLHFGVCCSLDEASLRRECDLVIRHCNRIIQRCCYVDFKRVSCLFIVGLAQTFYSNCRLLLVFDVRLADAR